MRISLYFLTIVTISTVDSLKVYETNVGKKAITSGLFYQKNIEQSGTFLTNNFSTCIRVNIKRISSKANSAMLLTIDNSKIRKKSYITSDFILITFWLLTCHVQGHNSWRGAGAVGNYPPQILEELLTLFQSGMADYFLRLFKVQVFKTLCVNPFSKLPKTSLCKIGDF